MLTAQEAKEIADKIYQQQAQEYLDRLEEIKDSTYKLLPEVLEKIQKAAKDRGEYFITTDDKYEIYCFEKTNILQSLGYKWTTQRTINEIPIRGIISWH